MIKNNTEKKEENTTLNIRSPNQQNSYNIQMMEAVNRDPQVFSSLYPAQQVNLAHDLQKTYGNQYVQRLIKSQKRYENLNEVSLQTKKENTNNTIEPKNETGMPDSLKENVENLSGLSLDDVRVHYNSSKPEQLDALAYTQGTDIYVAPGQEKHLPHETWHAVQQKQGRVQPTMQLHGVNINDNEELEREADVISEKSIQTVSKSKDMKKSFENMPKLSFDDIVPQRKMNGNVSQAKLVQRQSDKSNEKKKTSQKTLERSDEQKSTLYLVRSKEEKSYINNELLIAAKTSAQKALEFLKVNVVVITEENELPKAFKRTDGRVDIVHDEKKILNIWNEHEKQAEKLTGIKTPHPKLPDGDSYGYSGFGGFYYYKKDDGSYIYVPYGAVIVSFPLLESDADEGEKVGRIVAHEYRHQLGIKEHVDKGIGDVSSGERGQEFSKEDKEMMEKKYKEAKSIESKMKSLNTRE